MGPGLRRDDVERVAHTALHSSFPPGRRTGIPDRLPCALRLIRVAGERVARSTTARPRCTVSGGAALLLEAEIDLLRQLLQLIRLQLALRPPPTVHVGAGAAACPAATRR